jgi:hypothetical protein
MAYQSAKNPGSKPPKPQSAPVSPTAADAQAGSKANSGSKPNALLARSLAPVTADARRTMIAEAAYYIAQQRGFEQGREVENWLLAEKQIDTALSP